VKLALGGWYRLAISGRNHDTKRPVSTFACTENTIGKENIFKQIRELKITCAAEQISPERTAGAEGNVKGAKRNLILLWFGSNKKIR